MQPPTYFKKLMMKAKVNLNNLESIDTYMYANSNISDFSDYFCNQMAALTACGETTHNLLNNLFKAYTRVECGV
jgi:hypothetical protein